MKIWKFVGVSSRQALRQVKEALGPDALIIANRAVEGGVEMSALAGGDIAALDSGSGTEPATKPAPAETITVSTSGVSAGSETAKATARKSRAPRKSRRAKPIARERAMRDAPASGRGEARQVRWAQELAETVIREIHSMRGTIESQLAALAFGDPRAAAARGPLLSAMLGAGFSAAFARELLLDLPAGSSQQTHRDWMRAQLAARLATPAGEDEIVKRGGVYALVGPTGVGKTTTTAKIAARCVVRHGAENVALLTTDSYRIGAHEQLRIYGRILGVPVHTVRDASDLQATLAPLRGRHIVLIDTMGMSQHDQMVAEQCAMLAGSACEVKKLLLLNATCSADTLYDVVSAYRGGSAQECIITKADEAATLGAALEVAMRERLVVHYLANGQRVPEDLSPAERGALLDAALADRPRAPGVAATDAYACLAASTLSATHLAAARVA
jgi:flagellar biosynthesis protein FlhF